VRSFVGPAKFVSDAPPERRDPRRATQHPQLESRPPDGWKAGSAMTETVIEFGVLGPLQVTIDGTALPLGTPKQRAVLAMLVVNRNRPVGIEALIAAAWEQWPPPGVRASLHTYVSNVRRLLTNAGESRHTVLASAAPGYRLTIPDDRCDLSRFIIEKRAGVQAAAAGRFEEASEHLSAALAQWRGPVLDDLRDFQFVESFASALTEDKLIVHTARAEAEIACGRASMVISELEPLTIEHPYLEPLWAQLITAYYLADRQSDALEAYRRLKTVLADDLGIDPSPRLRALHDQVLGQKPIDAKQAAQTSAASSATAIEQRTAVTDRVAIAWLRDSSGHCLPLQAVATRIGRRPENDIVLSDANVSRHHAVIVDTGTTFIITDLRSANGVEVQHQRIRPTATLNDGDQIRICDHEFTFEMPTRTAHPDTA
jgi:DNA-binding SARP family transcriptional activator